MTDASVLINFAWIERFDLLDQLEGVDLLVSTIVLAEVSRPHHAALLAEALRNGWLQAIAPTHEEVQATITIRAEHRLDAGESECLAVAASRGFGIACDEKGNRFRSAAQALLDDGRVINTPGLVVLALRQSSLTLAEADRFIEVWRRNRYAVQFTSFVEVMVGESEGGWVGEGIAAGIRHWTLTSSLESRARFGSRNTGERRRAIGR